MAAEETVYSAEPLLRSPRRFAAAAAADLAVARRAAWRMWLRGLQGRHRQSRLGYAWLLGPPLALALTWVYLDHAGIVRFGDPGIPYVAYVLIGALLWQVFADAVQAPLRELRRSRHVLTKAKLPHEAWFAVAAIDLVFNLVLRLAVIAVVMVAAGISLRTEILLVPIGLFALIALGYAIGLALTPVGLLYDDVAEALPIVTGFWFFLTPVIYPWPIDLPGTLLVELNPVTPVLVTTRAWLTGAPGAAPGQLALVLAVSLAVAAAAWLVYRLARPHLIARL